VLKLPQSEGELSGGLRTTNDRPERYMEEHGTGRLKKSRPGLIKIVRFLSPIPLLMWTAFAIMAGITILIFLSFTGKIPQKRLHMARKRSGNNPGTKKGP